MTNPRPTGIFPVSMLFPGLSAEDLAARLGSPARAKAALRWLYSGGLPGPLPAAVPGVAASAWRTLRAQCDAPAWRVLSTRDSPDGTTKFALDLGDRVVETVLIPGPRRSTVCVSSQAGCTRACAFCATATLGFGRNLRAAEIVAQYLLARSRAPADRPARNVVFMGMGEPLDNLDEVLQAVRLLTQRPVPALSPAHITVSTSGVVPAMRRFLRECASGLALSLNATTDETRKRLMPHTRSWPIAALLGVLREFPERMTFVEYVLFDGVNDTARDADRLCALLEGLRVRVNLVPFNGFDGAQGLRPPPDARCRDFQGRVLARGVRCMIRWPRGRDIDAACGQLAARA